METISIIVPCYNEEETISKFFSAFITDTEPMREKVSFEFIFIDDGSKDNTLKEIKKLQSISNEVHYISFSRNFGKEAAMYAGLKKSAGDYAAIMDVDLQDPPSTLIEMYDIVKNGEYDCAAARRSDRQGEPVIKSFFSRKFYKIINMLSETEFVDGARDFRLMSRRMVNSILKLSEYNRFSKGLFSWVGYNTKWISYENKQRSAGSTKWNFFKLFLYSLDGIIAFSTMPLAVSSVLGILCILISLLLILAVIFKTLIWGDPVAGYPSLVCIILLIAGLILFSIGILGQYTAKIYLEVKNRPIYIIKESDDTE